MSMIEPTAGDVTDRALFAGLSACYSRPSEWSTTGLPSRETGLQLGNDVVRIVHRLRADRMARTSTVTFLPKIIIRV